MLSLLFVALALGAGWFVYINRAHIRAWLAVTAANIEDSMIDSAERAWH